MKDSLSYTYVRNDTKRPQTTEQLFIPKDADLPDQAAMTLNYHVIEDRLHSSFVTNRTDVSGLPR